MKNKLLIFIIVVAVIISVIIIISTTNNKSKNNEDNYVDYSALKESDRKIAFSKEKQYNGLKIRNGTITIAEDGKAVFMADVINESNEVKEEQDVNLKFLNRRGKNIQEIDISIDKLSINETMKLNVEFTTEYALEIYNFEIIKR